MILHTDDAGRVICLVPPQPTVVDLTTARTMRFTILDGVPEGLVGVHVELFPDNFALADLDSYALLAGTWTARFTYEPATNQLWYGDAAFQEVIADSWWLWSAAVYWREHLQPGRAFTRQLHTLLLGR